MADYAIGDVQGCYDTLQRLLTHIDFNDRTDKLWFVGDLVNRGPQSLEVLRFVKTLPLKPVITLGNHDLYLLSRLTVDYPSWKNSDDTLETILAAPDRDAIGDWLRNQPILAHDPTLNIVMCHAGIAPMWDLSQAKDLALELENALSGDHYREFLMHMYGNEPVGWSANLTGFPRLRVICNYFTRMRFCDAVGNLVENYKGSVQQAPSHLYPWFAVPGRKDLPVDIIFGHWAALEGVCPHAHIYALDTGSIWGGSLTALRLHDRQRFAVHGTHT